MAKRRTTKQYSKRVVTAMIIAWFAGIAFGMAVIVWQMIRAPDAVPLDSFAYVHRRADGLRDRRVSRKIGV